MPSVDSLMNRKSRGVLCSQGMSWSATESPALRKKARAQAATLRKDGQKVCCRLACIDSLKPHDSILIL